jgi:flagellar assembly protein FliH
MIADETIERGGLLLETGQGWIEDGPSVRLDRLRAELDRMGAPA